MYKKNIGLNFVIIFLFVLSINAQQKFVANLTGYQVVPQIPTSAKAVCKFTLNAEETRLGVSCDYLNLSSNFTRLGFHPARFGQNIAQFAFFSSTSGSINGSLQSEIPLSSTQLNNLRTNSLYVTISNSAFPNGEIRGQIKLANGTYNDYDGDSRADLAVYRSSNSTYYSLSSLYGNIRAENFGASGGSSSLNADYDGDGLTDFSIARTVSGQITWYIFNSETNTLKQTEWGNQTLGDFFASGDYDGDGKFDIAVFRAGVWYIIESSTGQPRYEYFGQSLDIPFVNDFDKDGKWDLAVVRNENGQRVWYYQQSRDGQIKRIEWGISSDAFFVGRVDFDGDSAADILVIRNISGQRNFFVLRSSDGQMQTIPWGLSSDLPKLADYDGDGKTDACVTRNVSGVKNWFILQSSNNLLRTEYFGLSSDL
jgi:hypothetical protein